MFRFTLNFQAINKETEIIFIKISNITKEDLNASQRTFSNNIFFIFLCNFFNNTKILKIIKLRILILK